MFHHRSNKNLRVWSKNSESLRIISGISGVLGPIFKFRGTPRFSGFLGPIDTVLDRKLPSKFRNTNPTNIDQNIGRVRNCRRCYFFQIFHTSFFQKLKNGGRFRSDTNVRHIERKFSTNPTEAGRIIPDEKIRRKKLNKTGKKVRKLYYRHTYPIKCYAADARSSADLLPLPIRELIQERWDRVDVKQNDSITYSTDERINRIFSRIQNIKMKMISY